MISEGTSTLKKILVKFMVSSRGNGLAEVVIFAALTVFLVFPVFSVLLEKSIIGITAAEIRDAIDMSASSAINSLIQSEFQEGNLSFSDEELLKTFRTVLAENLKLDDELMPDEDSLCADRVEIISLLTIYEGLPVLCPDGTQITRPTVHCKLMIPVKPAMYTRILLQLLNRHYIEIIVHTDTQIPLNK